MDNMNDMNAAARAARNAYRRQWAKENPDKVQAQQIRYWNRKAQELQQTHQTQQEREA